MERHTYRNREIDTDREELNQTVRQPCKAPITSKIIQTDNGELISCFSSPQCVISCSWSPTHMLRRISSNSYRQKIVQTGIISIRSAVGMAYFSSNTQLGQAQKGQVERVNQRVKEKLQQYCSKHGLPT